MREIDLGIGGLEIDAGAAAHDAAGPVYIRSQTRTGAVAIRKSVTRFGGVNGMVCSQKNKNCESNCLIEDK